MQHRNASAKQGCGLSAKQLCNLRSAVAQVLVFFATAFAASSALAETVMVVPDQYLIERRREAKGQVTTAAHTAYITHSSAEFFDVVVPKSKASRRALSASYTPTPLNWSVVRKDCQEIMKDPSVTLCEPNVLFSLQALPNDTDFPWQWGLDDPTTDDADIRAAVAWNRGTGNKNTLIGVIDSGIYWRHPDLSANLWSNPNEPFDGKDNDGNGYVDDIFGVNTALKTGDPDDCGGHGTHVSGIIGARGNNSLGVSGANWTTSLIVASTDSNCDGRSSFDAIIDAYDYFVGLKRRGHNIRVINASFGNNTFSQIHYNAINRLKTVDIILVGAAGNENSNNDVVPSYPDGYDLPNIISVGATGPTLQRASYSNYGQSVDIAAPGGDISVFGAGAGIWSTFSPLTPDGRFFKELEGTSMAAPMVTGAIGLIASQRPQLTGTHLKNMLLATADEVPALVGKVNKGRFLNLGAMAYAPDPPDNCPANPNKLEPGVCGCSKPDSYRDANANSILDCNEPNISKVVPPPPVVIAGIRSVSFTMTPKAGVKYYIELTIQPKGGRPKKEYYIGTVNKGTVTGIKSGASVTVRYAYMIQGTPRTYSSYSPAKKVKVR